MKSIQNKIAKIFLIVSLFVVWISAGAGAVHAEETQDTTPPVIHSFTPADNTVIGGKAASISAEARDAGGSGVVKLVFQVSLDDAASWIDIGTLEGDQLKYNAAYGSASGTLTWDVTAGAEGIGPLTDGAYKFRVIAYDKAGNVSNGTPVRVWKTDSTAPATPANFRGSAAVDQITLDWSPNTEADMYYYRIYRSTVPGGDYELVRSVYYSGTQLRHSENVKGGTTYYYIIKAEDRVGNQSAPSAEVAVTPLIDETAPTVAWIRPDEGGTVGGTSTSISVRITDNSPLGIAARTFEYSVSGSGDWINIGSGTAGGSNGYSATWQLGAISTGSYDLRVTAVDHSGHATTVARTVFVDKDASAPVISASSGDGSIVISWPPVPDPDFGSYSVRRANTLNGGYSERIKITDPSITTFTDGSVNNGQTYYYKVIFTDLYGNTAESNIVSAQPGGDQSAPELISVSIADGAVVGGPKFTFDVRATDNQRVAVMEAEYSTDGGASWSSQGLTSGTVSGPNYQGYYQSTFTWNTEGITDGEVLVRIRAFDASGNVDEMQVRWLMDKTVSAATGVSAVVDQNKVTISWTAVQDADLNAFPYRVHRLADGVETASNWLSKTTTAYTDTIDPSKNYIYKVETRDSLGNTAFSAEVAVNGEQDDEAPVIVSVSPSDRTLLGTGEYELRVNFTDNYGSSGTSAVFEYSLDGEQWVPAQGVMNGPYSANPPHYFTQKWYIKDLKGDSVQVRFTVRDASGNTAQKAVTYLLDLTPPAAPQNLIGSFDGTGSITLTWQPPEDLDVAKYVIYRATSAEGPYTQIGQVTGRDTLTYKDSSVPAALTYYYVVYAVDAFNQQGQGSNIAPAAAIKDTEAPVVTSITPGGGQVIEANEIAITVHAADNLALSSIALQYSVNGGADWTEVAKRAATGGSAAFTLAVDDLIGEVQVRAIAQDSFGNVSDGTPVHSYWIDRAAPMVTQLSPESGNFADTIPLQAEATDDAGLAALAFQYSTDAVNWIDLDETLFDGAPVHGAASYDWDVSALAEGTYFVRAVARDAAGKVSESTDYVQYNIERVTVPEEDLEAPVWPEGSGLTVAEITETSAKLIWDSSEDNVGVAFYNIYVDDEIIDTVASSVYSYDLTGLSAGTTYDVKVEAGDAAGNLSAERLNVQFTTSVPAPAVTVALVTSRAELNVMEEVILTATVSGLEGIPSGKVSFYDGSTLLATADVTNGTASFATTSLQSGTYQLTAVYHGDSDHPGGTSSVVPVTFTSSQSGPVMNYTLTENYATTPRGVQYVNGFTLTLTPPSWMTATPATMYRFNGQGDWAAYEGPVSFGFDIMMIEYQSADEAGNAGPVITLDFISGVYDKLLGTP